MELGTHDELMAVGGRYRTMFELQASRFGEDTEEREWSWMPAHESEIDLPPAFPRCGEL